MEGQINIDEKTTKYTKKLQTETFSRNRINTSWTGDIVCIVNNF